MNLNHEKSKNSDDNINDDIDDMDEISDERPTKVVNKIIDKNLNDEELFDLLENIDYNKGMEEINKLENKKSDTKETVCINCNISDQIVEDSSQGILVCMGCGQVISNLMDENPEWRQYGED